MFPNICGQRYSFSPHRNQGLMDPCSCSRLLRKRVRQCCCTCTRNSHPRPSRRLPCCSLRCLLAPRACSAAVSATSFCACRSMHGARNIPKPTCSLKLPRMRSIVPHTSFTLRHNHNNRTIRQRVLKRPPSCHDFYC